MSISNLPEVVVFVKIVPVSYTHLRAHETREDLVCRLLLEKKITDNGKFTAGVNFKNTSQNVNSLTGNVGFKLNF